MDNKTLNEPAWTSRFLEGRDLRGEFALALEGVCANYYDKRRNRLDYRRLATSEEYLHLFRMSRSLPFFPVEELEERTEQLGFWLNVYNAMVIDLVVSEHLDTGPMQLEGFFTNYQYRIGNHLLSLDDIEHGILRANGRKWMALTSHFPKSDPRLAFALKRVDPRVHFAFACGALSSPPLRAYPADRVDALLDEVTAEHLARHVELDRHHGKLRVPKLFKWYKKDFGKEQDVILFIIKHLADPETQDYLHGNIRKISLAYLDFDWQLNTQ